MKELKMRLVVCDILRRPSMDKCYKLPFFKKNFFYCLIQKQQQRNTDTGITKDIQHIAHSLQNQGIKTTKHLHKNTQGNRYHHQQDITNLQGCRQLLDFFPFQKSLWLPVTLVV